MVQSCQAETVVRALISVFFLGLYLMLFSHYSSPKKKKRNKNISQNKDDLKPCKSVRWLKMTNNDTFVAALSGVPWQLNPKLQDLSALRNVSVLPEVYIFYFWKNNRFLHN